MSVQSTVNSNKRAKFNPTNTNNHHEITSNHNNHNQTTIHDDSIAFQNIDADGRILDIDVHTVDAHTSADYTADTVDVIDTVTSEQKDTDSNNDVTAQVISSTGKIYDADEFDIPAELLADAAVAPTGSNADTVVTNNQSEQLLTCCECDSIKIQKEYYAAFNIGVCYLCAREHSDKYELIPKTQCKVEYLVDDKQLSNLKYMLKSNPNKQSYSAMKLYRRVEIEQISFGAYSDMCGVAAEKVRRETTKLRRDEQKRKQQKKKQERELKAEQYATDMSTHAIQSPQHHTHTYKSINNNQSKCTVCGFIVQELEL